MRTNNAASHPSNRFKSQQPLQKRQLCVHTNGVIMTHRWVNHIGIPYHRCICYSRYICTCSMINVQWYTKQCCLLFNIVRVRQNYIDATTPKKPCQINIYNCKSEPPVHTQIRNDRKAKNMFSAGHSLKQCCKTSCGSTAWRLYSPSSPHSCLH